MKEKSLKSIPYIVLIGFFSMMVLLSSCRNNDEPEIIPDDEDPRYCLAFYCSGGDPAHDLSFMNSVYSAVSSTRENPMVTVSVLFKYSGGAEGAAHNGIRRYFGENGILTLDSTYVVPEDFEITDESNLCSFLKWTRERFPGRRYVFVYAGHGMNFVPEGDFPESSSRATLYDDGKVMTSAAMARGIRDAAIPLSAMIANSCQQGNIEMFAEWEGLADYFLGSSFSIPDVGYDYASFVNDLSSDYDIEQALARMARRTLNLWQEYHDSRKFGSVLTVIRLKGLAPLWDSLRNTFNYMRNSVDETSYCTDSPAIEGEKFGLGYLRAMYASLERTDSVFENFRPLFSVDLGNYLRNAFLYTGNILLATYVNEVDDCIDRVLAFHGQTDGKNDFIFNTYFDSAFGDPEVLKRYRECRFDRLTGWSDLCVTLLSFGNTPP